MIAQALRRRCATCEGAGEVTVNDTNPHGYGPDPQCDEDVPCPVTDCIDGWVPVEGATLYLEGPGKATLELDVDADGMIADARPGRGGQWVGAIVVGAERLEVGDTLRTRRPGSAAQTQQWRVTALEYAE